MRKLFFSLIFILLFVSSGFSQEITPAGKPLSGKTRFVYQMGIGSFYAAYPPLIKTTTDSMDSGSLIRFPGTIYFQFGSKMTEKLSWNTSLTTGLDSYSDKTGLFQLYSLLLSGGIEFTPFPIDLTMGLDLGYSLLIPNTDLSYSGAVESGSGIGVSAGYIFKGLRFGKPGIIPGIKIKIIHSELFRGSVDQINIYLNLTIQ